MHARRIFSLTSLALSVFGPASALADELPMIASASGTPETRTHRQLPWRAASKGQGVRLGAELRCPGGCSLRFPKGGTITLDAGASAVVLDPLFFLLPGEDRGHQLEGVEVREGVVTVEPAGRPLLVQTPGEHSAVVRSGVGRVAAHKAGAFVGAASGESLVKTARTWTALRPGEATTLTSAGARPPRPLVRAPKLVTPPASSSKPTRLAFALGSPFAMVGETWVPEPAAARYEAEFSDHPSFERILARTATPDGSASTAFGPGTYFARVRGVDAEGFSSAFSPPSRLTVIAGSGSPGVFAAGDGGTVVLPEGGSLRLNDADKLEVAIDKGIFRKAPAFLPAPRGDSQRVRMRLRADPGAETAIILERRAVRAEIASFPKFPVWPADAVDLEVTIHDPNGRVPADGVVPSVSVLLGIDPLAVEWRQSGNVWSARIPARPAAVPTVLRVTVTDEHGLSLGRGAVEIAPAKPTRVVVANR
jgi:hypothetical protein